MENRNFDKDIQLVIHQHPKLKYDKISNRLFGEITVDVNDEYEVEIDLSPFPQGFPIVKEVGERIPPIADRHIYTNSLSCCFDTKAHENILMKTKVKTIQDFINKIVVPYFQNQSYYEINGCYRHGEYSHGVIGSIEGYQDILKVKDIRIICMMLFGRINNYKIRPNDKCYCGSQRKIKKCHHNSYREFRQIDVSIIKSDFNSIMEFTELAMLMNRAYNTQMNGMVTSS